MIEKEGKMQVEITGAWWETISSDEKGDTDIAKITFKDANGDEDELSMWLSSDPENYGKYKGKAQFEANLDRLTKAGMTDGDPDNIGDIVGKAIAVFGKLKEKNDKTYYVFYWQDGAVQAKPSAVKDRVARLKKLRGSMAGTPTDAPPPADEGDDDNLPF